MKLGTITKNEDRKGNTRKKRINQIKNNHKNVVRKENTRNK